MPTLDVMEDVRARLEKALGVPARVTVPKERPKNFVVVRRNGGHRLNALQDRPGLDVMSYAPTEAEASALSSRVSDLMLSLPRTSFLDGYELVEEESRRSDPDPDTGTPRWYASYTLTTFKR
ncbi:MAG: hypothetical protein ACI360_08575 [Atopobiaceae bacterium]